MQKNAVVVNEKEVAQLNKAIAKAEKAAAGYQAALAHVKTTISAVFGSTEEKPAKKPRAKKEKVETVQVPKKTAVNKPQKFNGNGSNLPSIPN